MWNKGEKKENLGRLFHSMLEKYFDKIQESFSSKHTPAAIKQKNLCKARKSSQKNTPQEDVSNNISSSISTESSVVFPDGYAVEF
jgi:hypothetical protein